MKKAFGLIEVVMAVFVTAVLLSASLRTLSAAKRREATLTEQSAVFLLANDLMQEILQQEYEDPNQIPSFGPEAEEVTGTRTAFDDVDDYHLLTISPPESREGIALPRFSGLTQNVVVEWVAALPPHAVVANESGLKRITVTITHDGTEEIKLVGYRSKGFQQRIQL